METNISLSGNERLKIDDLIKKQYANIRGISVFQNGENVYERYFGRKKESDKFNVASVTKSILSILIGIAIDKGYIKSVQEKVVDFFPEYQFDDTNKVRNRVTIEHLLTMTAPFPFPNMREPLGRMCRQKDWVQYSLQILGTGGRLGTFKYSTSGAHTLSAILTKGTQMSGREFANKFLFEPLNIPEIPFYPMQFDINHIFGSKVQGWVSDPKGYSAGGWGLTLSLEEMAKIGQLCIQGGTWADKQVVSKEWLHSSIIPRKNNYGYLWWIGESEGEYMAVGSGGNIIYVNEESRTVIAIASTIVSRPRDRKYLIDTILTSLKL